MLERSGITTLRKSGPIVSAYRDLQKLSTHLWGHLIFAHQCSMGQTRRRSRGGALLTQVRKASLRANAQKISGKLKPSVSSYVSRKFRVKSLHRPGAEKYIGSIIREIKDQHAENAAYEAREKELDRELRRMNRKMRKEEKSKRRASNKRFSMKNLFSALPE